MHQSGKEIECSEQHPRLCSAVYPLYFELILQHQIRPKQTHGKKNMSGQLWKKPDNVCRKELIETKAKKMQETYVTPNM